MRRSNEQWKCKVCDKITNHKKITVRQKETNGSIITFSYV